MADRWRPRLAWAVFCLPALAICAPAYAQVATVPAAPIGAEPPSAGSEGFGVYDEAFFSPYNPVNANDMVLRVPGFSIDEGADRRGFGAAAGNVLINGERPSSKTSISEQLKRIPASAVARIELISGGAGNLEIRGQALLANVVLKSAQAGASLPGTWVLGAQWNEYSNRVEHIIQGSKSFALWEGAELALDLQFPNMASRNESVYSVRSASGALIESSTTFFQSNDVGVAASADLKWRVGPQDRVNINARYEPSWETSDFNRLSYGPSGALTEVFAGRSQSDGEQEGEIGADWEHSFNDGLAFKLIGLATFSNRGEAEIYDTSSPTSPPNTQTYDSTAESGERVGRGFFTWTINTAHTLEVGLEGAFNYLDTTLNIFNQTPGGPRVPEPLAGSNARVEETRAEAFVTDVWTLSERLSLETGLVFEASRITQTGDESKEREFTYPKPSASLTWRPDAETQFRASIKRDVSQLNFSEFASRADVFDSYVTKGNPGLVPEKAWKYRIEWDRRFGQLGAFNVALFHDEVQDVSGLVVLEQVQNVDGVDVIKQYDAYGNIGDGTRQGIEVSASAPLDRLGIPRSEIRFTGLLQETKVTDPLTGEERSFTRGWRGDWDYTVTFRQELPKLKSAWGSEISQSDGHDEYRRSEAYFYDRPEPALDLYYETTAIDGITLRFTARNIFSPNEHRVRTVYFDSPTDPASPRAAGIIDHIEYRKQKGGFPGSKSFVIRASGKF